MKTLPYTVWIYAAIVAAVLVFELLIGGVDSSAVGGVITLVVATLGLVVGIWFAWLFLTFVAAAHLILVPWMRPLSWDLLLNGVMLALLLLRATRDHAIRWRPRRPRLT
jgi:hypothetical protein